MPCRDLGMSVKIMENDITVILQSAMIKHTVAICILICFTCMEREQQYNNGDL